MNNVCFSFISKMPSLSLVFIRTDTPRYHAIVAASMLPRPVGGVVDNWPKVYGTINIRLVDASIQPMQLSGHPMVNLYAIAKWVLDITKEDADAEN